jgi:hypothetical protein
MGLPYIELFGCFVLVVDCVIALAFLWLLFIVLLPYICIHWAGDFNANSLGLREALSNGRHQQLNCTPLQACSVCVGVNLAFPWWIYYVPSAGRNVFLHHLGRCVCRSFSLILVFCCVCDPQQFYLIVCMFLHFLVFLKLIYSRALVKVVGNKITWQVNLKLIFGISCVPCPCTILYKNINHKQMHKESFIINCNTLTCFEPAGSSSGRTFLFSLH